jgi:plastocyanin
MGMRIQRLASLVLLALVALVGCGSSSQSTDSQAPSPPSASSTAAPATAKSPPAEEEVAEVAEGWGHLKGQFIYDGSPPAQSPLTITKDPEFCGQHRIVDESLVVNGENGGLANAVVYLSVRRGQDAPQSHESYAETADARVTLDNDKCRFEPHISLLRTSQTLLIKNSDPVGHNTNIAASSNASFNQTIPSGSEIEHHFDAVERRPAAVSCNIHPWMKGWILPIDTPYFAVSRENGEFEINNLPSGTWTFQVWHEKAGGIGEVTMDGKTTKWSKGRVSLTINADTVTDLGEIKLSEALFQ